jgi:cell wall-associated NlpC family hydrolase
LRLRARRALSYAIVGLAATIAGALSAPGEAWATAGGAAAVPATALHGKHGKRRHPHPIGVADSSGSGGASPQSLPSIPHAPITARTPALHYTGPVYEFSLEGQLVPYVPPTAEQVLDGSTGGSAVSTAVAIKPRLVVPGRLARLVDGLAAAPMEAPESVKGMIWTANEIIGLPYIYGGGHASWHSPGYDCSGTVSYALHGANLLSAPEDSSELEGFGGHGVGEWVTVFANPGHAYMDVAGLRLDTSAADDPSNQQGPRWRPLRQSNTGYRVRHPVGL